MRGDSVKQSTGSGIESKGGAFAANGDAAV
jgi:hypothetical protein